MTCRRCHGGRRLCCWGEARCAAPRCVAWSRATAAGVDVALTLADRCGCAQHSNSCANCKRTHALPALRFNVRLPSGAGERHHARVPNDDRSCGHLLCRLRDLRRSEAGKPCGCADMCCHSWDAVHVLSFVRPRSVVNIPPSLTRSLAHSLTHPFLSNRCDHVCSNYFLFKT
jgi:hypothetical protein